MVGVGVAVVRAFVVDVEALKFLVIVGQVLDVHPPAHFPPEVELGQPLLRAHQPPAEAGVPANRLVDKRGEHVEKILVGDGEAAVDLIHPPQGRLAAVAVVAPFHQLADDDIGVVVALLGPRGKLAGLIQQGGNARNAERTKQGELQRTRGIKRELVAGAKKNDPLVVPHWVEAANFVENR